MTNTNSLTSLDYNKTRGVIFLLFVLIPGLFFSNRCDADTSNVSAAMTEKNNAVNQYFKELNSLSNSASPGTSPSAQDQQSLLQKIATPALNKFSDSVTKDTQERMNQLNDDYKAQEKAAMGKYQNSVLNAIPDLQKRNEVSQDFAQFIADKAAQKKANKDHPTPKGKNIKKGTTRDSAHSPSDTSEVRGGKLAPPHIDDAPASSPITTEAIDGSGIPKELEFPGPKPSRNRKSLLPPKGQ